MKKLWEKIKMWLGMINSLLGVAKLGLTVAKNEQEAQDLKDKMDAGRAKERVIVYKDSNRILNIYGKHMSRPLSFEEAKKVAEKHVAPDLNDR